MQEPQAVLNAKRAEKLRQSLGADQDDIDVAFEADGLSFSDPNKAGTLP